MFRSMQSDQNLCCTTMYFTVSMFLLTDSGSPGLEIIKLSSCSTELSIKFFMLINLQLLTIANSFLLNIAEHENFSANKYGNANLLAEKISCSAELSMIKVL